MLFANVQFLIHVWDYSVVRGGLGVLPIAVSSMVVSPLTGRLGVRFGVRRVGVPGVALVALGAALQAAVLESGERAFLTAWIPTTAIIGMGMALTYPMIALACVQGVGGDDFSVASATNRTALQVGNAIGLATVIAILGASAAETIHEFRLAWVVLAGVSLLCALAIAATSPFRRTDRPRAAPTAVVVSSVVEAG
jgi:MFS family permease